MAPTLMRAARWHGRRDLRVDLVPIPDCKPHEVLLAVDIVGLCGTDLHEYLEGPIEIPQRPHPLTGRQAPVTLGHEIVATVLEPAADGSGPQAGTRVMPDTMLGCGTCWWCRRHEAGQCSRQAVVGLHTDGGLAEYMTATASRLLRIPDGLPPEVAVLAEPLSCGIRATRKVGSSVLGATVLVMGAGTIGLLLTQVLRNAGAANIIIVDPERPRTELARRMGATRATQPSTLEGLVRQLDEPGVDLVFECSGAAGNAALGAALVRPGGSVVLVGIHGGTEPVALLPLIVGERRIIGSAGHVWDSDVRTALHMLGEGSVDVSALLTLPVELRRTTDTLERMAAGHAGLKSLVAPGAGLLP